MNKPIIIGLTGPTGAGKSTVCSFLKKYNCKIIDADMIAHKVLETNIDCKSKLVSEFGQNIVNQNGDIIRKELAKVAFSSKEKTYKLNKITHPFILSELKILIHKNMQTGTNAIIIDAALLFECNCNSLCDIIISVVANKKNRQKRIISRDNIDSNLASIRMSSQKPVEFYIKNSDYIINNNSSMDDLKNKTKSLFAYLTESHYET